MRWLALLIIVYLPPVLVQPEIHGGTLWSLALADDDADDNGDDDDGDDDNGDDDDDGGGRASDAGPGGGSSGERGSGGPDLFDSLFGDDDDDRGFIEDEIVGIALDSLDIAALELVGFRLTEEVELDALGISVTRLAAPAGLDTPGALALARATRPGASFDFNHLYQNSGSSCGPERCWGGHLVGVEIQALASCTEGRAIAIIDTAVDSRHPVLRDSLVLQRTFRPTGSREVPSGHGTAIAALLVGRTSGDIQALVPQARLFAADVFYLQGDAVRSDALAILRALDWAVESEAEVIALSLSGAANGALERGIRAAARRAGLVAAAGNGGPNGEPAFPAAYPEVLAVTAIDVRKRPYRYANRGSYIELAAPGVDIWSADAGGGFTNWTGTSFAVPFAAAALLHARALSGRDPVRARELLVQSAEDLGALGRDEVFGWGLLRAPRSACR